MALKYASWIIRLMMSYPNLSRSNNDVTRHPSSVGLGRLHERPSEHEACDRARPPPTGRAAALPSRRHSLSPADPPSAGVDVSCSSNEEASAIQFAKSSE